MSGVGLAGVYFNFPVFKFVQSVGAHGIKVVTQIKSSSERTQ